MAQFEKHFTLAEANALVPWVRSVFFKAGRIMEEVMIAQQVQQPIPPWVEEGKRANGHGKTEPAAEGMANVVDMDRLWSDLETDDKIELINGLMTAIQEEGIVIQDVRQGLIDFPGLRDGREILLCYMLSDGEQIGFWHELQEGFAGRQPLDELIR